MPELFVTLDGLGWRHATWFEAPHGGTEDDRIALGGLRHELERP